MGAGVDAPGLPVGLGLVVCVGVGVGVGVGVEVAGGVVGAGVVGTGVAGGVVMVSDGTSDGAGAGADGVGT